jgi:hypothetical protein
MKLDVRTSFYKAEIYTFMAVDNFLNIKIIQKIT